MSRPTKEFHQYLTNSSKSHVSHTEYLVSPATAFLKFTVEAKSSIDLCIRYFPKNQDGNYKKDSLDSLQHLVIAVLPTIMGHFETYQRYLFSGIFEMSIYLENFDANKFFKQLQKETAIEFDWSRVSAYRSIGTGSIGSLLADTISGWHDPAKVNKYFSAFNLQYTLFSNDKIENLKTLWQLRHSIVHTGGTLSRADAQKVEALKEYGDNNICLENQFIFEVARKLHPIVKNATIGIGNKFKENLISSISEEESKKIDKFFEVKSSVSTWLR